MSRELVDWSHCPLVETNPRVQSGTPVLRGTRMPAEAIVANADFGVSEQEIARQFEIPVETVHDLLRYAASHRLAHPLR